ncbi:hypothetical protein M404DRAFT_36390 [Pisolithus tinctorius Marx 270]|uniref:Uncharacterized protein n=1 Tax=Pisolithus tinctorius Marx 270 TaxID=870435 RepID=A0A0C3J5W4_PISTI|nr:hypothetical protein M404DRAFT_36390 [Pisolithus tinctorius Marx 270]
MSKCRFSIVFSGRSHDCVSFSGWSDLVNKVTARKRAVNSPNLNHVNLSSPPIKGSKVVMEAQG